MRLTPTSIGHALRSHYPTPRTSKFSLPPIHFLNLDELSASSLAVLRNKVRQVTGDNTNLQYTCLPAKFCKADTLPQLVSSFDHNLLMHLGTPLPWVVFFFVSMGVCVSNCHITSPSNQRWAIHATFMQWVVRRRLYLDRSGMGSRS